MTGAENLGAFFKENKKLARRYLDTRLEIFRLRLTRALSKAAGNLIWIIISLFLLFLLFVFLGLVTGFWLSNVTGSYVKGFGITTLIILFVIIMLAVLRKTLFINPVIRIIIRTTASEPGIDDEEN